jgi:two-component system, NtrC family, response regulator HydG
MVSIVLIDDNAGSLEFLSVALEQEGVQILTADAPQKGLELVYRHHPQIVLTDLVMPGMSGMDVLDAVMKFDPTIDVLLMTAHYSTESAVEAIKRGACDYLNKPVSIAAIQQRIALLLTDARRRLRGAELEQELLDSSQFEGIIGRHPEMRQLFATVRRISRHFRTVLIHGETGTGKDLVARSLHRLSPSSKGQYVVVNCSAIVETLFESELFGHVKGAFTGADRDKIGLVELANGGVLFLDEIGDMPLGTQAKLLRVLQNQEVQRVGSLAARKVDVRVVAATHRDLRAAIVAGGFREDLFYRLSMVELTVPRLADRKDDLALLVRHFLAQFSKQFGKDVLRLSPRAEILLARHDWPGNVRELENVIGHASMMADGPSIEVENLPAYLRQRMQQTPTAAPSAASSAEESNGAAASGALSTLENQERATILSALEVSHWNQSEAARTLRIGRDALRYKMKKYNLVPENELL